MEPIAAEDGPVLLVINTSNHIMMLQLKEISIMQAKTCPRKTSLIIKNTLITLEVALLIEEEAVEHREVHIEEGTEVEEVEPEEAAINIASIQKNLTSLIFTHKLRTLTNLINLRNIKNHRDLNIKSTIEEKINQKRDIMEVMKLKKQRFTTKQMIFLRNTTNFQKRLSILSKNFVRDPSSVPFAITILLKSAQYGTVNSATNLYIWDALEDGLKRLTQKLLYKLCLTRIEKRKLMKTINQWVKVESL